MATPSLGVWYEGGDAAVPTRPKTAPRQDVEPSPRKILRTQSYKPPPKRPETYMEALSQSTFVAPSTSALVKNALKTKSGKPAKRWQQLVVDNDEKLPSVTIVDGESSFLPRDVFILEDTPIRPQIKPGMFPPTFQNGRWMSVLFPTQFPSSRKEAQQLTTALDTMLSRAEEAHPSVVDTPTVPQGADAVLVHGEGLLARGRAIDVTVAELGRHARAMAPPAVGAVEALREQLAAMWSMNVANVKSLQQDVVHLNEVHLALDKQYEELQTRRARIDAALNEQATHLYTLNTAISQLTAYEDSATKLNSRRLERIAMTNSELARTRARLPGLHAEHDALLDRVGHIRSTNGIMTKLTETERARTVELNERLAKLRLAVKAAAEWRERDEAELRALRLDVADQRRASGRATDHTP